MLGWAGDAILCLESHFLIRNSSALVLMNFKQEYRPFKSLLQLHFQVQNVSIDFWLTLQIAHVLVPAWRIRQTLYFSLLHTLEKALLF